MLWPLVLPFQITVFVLLLTVIVLTVSAPVRRWGRWKTFYVSSLLAMLAFIPACVGLSLVVDSIRFGDFKYESYNDISDFRSLRYLPESATNIQLRKYPSGYHARYNVSEADFYNYLDDLWDKYGDYSISKRGEISGDGETISKEYFDGLFGVLESEYPPKARQYYSPTEGDGGGARYLFDAEAGVVFQRTGFW